MTTLHWQGDLVAMLVIAAACWLVPWLVVGPAVGAFSKAGKTVRNYRGRDVPLGLGVVWIVWAAAVAVVGAVALTLSGRYGGQLDLAAGVLTAATGLLPAVAVAAVALAGLADDLYGTAVDRGIRGHFKALGEGRVTTGLMKLLVIVVAAAFACVPLLVEHRPLGWAATSGPVAYVTAVVLVAGTTNLLNLLDLRPGRSLKAYFVLLVAVTPALIAVPVAVQALPRPSGLDVALLTALAAAGPAFVCLRPDLREHSMLGDAGANAAGFVLGVLLAHAYSDVTLYVAAAVVVVLNVMSERVSFSAVIDRTPALHAFDMLGREPDDDDDDENGPGGTDDHDPFDREGPWLPPREPGPWDHWE
jgi:hypothetical protein